MIQPILVWFRRDLRLDDQPALADALIHGRPIIPFYVSDESDQFDWPAGAASRWWLHHSLDRLHKQLTSLGSRLIIRRGDALSQLVSVIDETQATAVFWTRCYEPASIVRDSRVKSELRSRGITAESSNGQLLFEPWDVKTKEGRPYQVFTPFWKSCLNRDPPEEPLPAPKRVPSPEHWPSSLTINQLDLLPKISWDASLKSTWQTGSNSAVAELNRFLESTVFEYDIARDQPGRRGTSRLSPYLHFGEISPRTIWHTTNRIVKELRDGRESTGAETFLKEIGWREFAYHLMYHFPKTTTQPLRPEYSRFPWREDAEGLAAWQRGQTGYPIVDAGMRELWNTGWMHNRVRMIVASFLVKDLLISWQRGAEWFWETLVDADLACNTLGWQWSAGCGADAAPYFRVFNPTSQSEKFDPNGEYLRRWLPELQKLPTDFLHAPWTAPEGILVKAAVRLGQTYPYPIVDHHEARLRALQALSQIKQRK